VRSFFLSVSTLTRICLIGLLIGLQGCSTTPDDETAKWPLDKLYQEAMDGMSSGAYDKAIKLFEKLETRAIGTPYAQQAQIEKAYAQYKTGDQPEALLTLNRFMRLHPASPLLDYALYLKGLVNFNGDLGFLSGITKQDLTDRDQKAAKESYTSFKELATRFPESKYAPDAKARMAYIQNTLAAYELHVARYYMSRGAYLAAVDRAQISVNEYPNAPVIEEALEIMIRSYDALGITQLRDDVKRVMSINYPKNKLGLQSATSVSNFTQKP
jgi:outer membrane protein assembly factor BamD